MTAREAAKRFGVSPMQMSHMEVGRIGVSEERLRRLADLYGCKDSALVDALAAMAVRRVRGWWEEYRGVIAPAYLDLAELEYHAKGLRALQVVHIPGILQTEAYARAIHAYVTLGLPPDNLEAIVDFRLKRRRILDRKKPPRLTFVIHEAALRIKVGDLKVVREQLEMILEAADRPNISVRVVPFEADGFGGAGCSMLYVHSTVPKLDTVQLDTPHGSTFLDAEADLATYRSLFSKIEAAALPPRQSRDLVYRIVREL